MGRRKRGGREKDGVREDRRETEIHCLLELAAWVSEREVQGDRQLQDVRDSEQDGCVGRKVFLLYQKNSDFSFSSQ